MYVCMYVYRVISINNCVPYLNILIKNVDSLKKRYKTYLGDDSHIESNFERKSN